jgi:phosphohistidine phosphatase
MHFYLVRHGMAEDRLKTVLKYADDSQRSLTVKGKKKFKKLAPRLKELIGSLDLIVSSPLLRAQQTAKIMSEFYPQVKVKTSKALVPTAQPDDWLKWLGIKLKNKNSRIMIVGHEPHLSSLASWLLFGDSHSRMTIKKGGCIAIDIKDNVGPATGVLQWAVTPKVLGIV